MIIGRGMHGDCAERDGHIVTKYLYVANFVLGAYGINQHVINNPNLDFDCGYYDAAFTFTSGAATDSLDGDLTLSILDPVGTPGDNNGIIVEPAD